NGAFNQPEDVYAPFALTEQLQLRTSGNINCWKDEPIDSFRDFLNSECVWLQYWVELPRQEHVQAYQSFIDNYAREQKRLGRFERPLNNRLQRPDRWLAVKEVVQDDNRVLVGLAFMFLTV